MSRDITPVDLQGRLSNPPYHFIRSAQTLPLMLLRDSGTRRQVNPQPQRRLKPAELNALVALYKGGASVAMVAETFGIHRDTVDQHLKRQPVARRANVRKMTDESLELATEGYLAGEPVSLLCDRFAVHPKTLLRELRAAGVQLRKPGRPKRRA